MKGKLSLGSIDNLYTSVKDLNSSWFIGSAKNSLLNPCVPHQFGCTSQPIHIPEEDPPNYWYDIVQESHLPLDDFEEHLVEIKNSREALKLLRASLTSKAALTNSLSFLLKKRKWEKCILG
ncbi:unnamed protein product [Sphenostylis stenocarpa]|uniref:Uncharacterized protein n=1 Tax=Sphenostylis stenocarpa TaxID=92480 RepID=A0AA86V570_9FABA|nr:unnamed protein product [Sphenostylis stenocarpa]